MVRSAMGILAVALGAASLAAQGNDAWSVTMQRIVDDTRAQGLPVDGLYERAKLGAVLRRPPADVTSAVREHARRLAASRAALQPAPGTVDIEAGALALANRVPESALRRIRAARADRSIAVPLGVLTQLVVSGLPVARATGVVLDAVVRGAQDVHFLAFQDDIMRDLERGVPLGSAFDLRARRLVATLPAVPGSSAAAELSGPTLGTSELPRQPGGARPGGKPPRP